MIETLHGLSAEMKSELMRILQFWGQAVDDEFGGFAGQISNSGQVNRNASKGAVLNTRILWTFSAAYRFSGDESYLKLAKRSYDYLLAHFWDKDHGGLIWETDYSGVPLDTKKQAYAQGFGIYAFSEYFLACENAESLEYAKELYFILEEHFKDREFGGYIEALSADWSPLKDMRLSLKDANCPKSMNTHLHILEPYTNLYRAWLEEKLKQNILDLIQIFRSRIIDSATGHFNLFFDMDWSVKSTEISFGHDIEGAWLLHEAALVCHEPELIPSVKKTALGLVNLTIQNGTDHDGAILYEQNGSHIDTDKHWWPQAEALVGLMDAWEIDKNDYYLSQLSKIWRFIQDKLIDKNKGEWFWRIDRKGHPYWGDDKAGFWKCPYHNSRALIEVINRIEKYF